MKLQKCAYDFGVTSCQGWLFQSTYIPENGKEMWYERQLLLFIINGIGSQYFEKAHQM